MVSGVSLTATLVADYLNYQLIISNWLLIING